VSTDITVYAAVDVTSAIIDQQYGTVIPGEGTVTFLMQIGYPFQLVLNDPGQPIDSVSSDYPISSTNLTSVSIEPATGPGDFTTQTFLLAITPAPNTCVLNGIYTAAVGRFTIQCLPSAESNNQCPQALDPQVGISLGISSSSFCAQVIANVSTTLSLESFADSEFTVPTTNFLIQPNGNAYFLVTVESSPEVTVNGLTVSRVQIYSVYLGSTVTLYNNAILPAGETFDFSVISNPPVSGVATAFSFGVVSAFDVPRDNLGDVVVTALIELSYESVNKKRMIQVPLQFSSPISTTPSHVSTSFSVFAPIGSFAPSLNLSFVVTVIGLVVGLLVA